jgi:hypothetical protein
MMEKEKDEQTRPRVEFRLGSVCITPGAQQVLTNEDVMSALGRHCRGDWGEVGAEDRAGNDLSVREGCRLLSAYRSKLGQKFWVITEADRSATTVLLPDEY